MCRENIVSAPAVAAGRTTEYGMQAFDDLSDLNFLEDFGGLPAQVFDAVTGDQPATAINARNNTSMEVDGEWPFTPVAAASGPGRSIAIA
jgi:hypothetical protein